MTQGSTTNAYTLGTGNRLASWTGGGACAYDAGGCVTNLVRSGKPTVALEWDAQYRVTAAYTNGVLAESYGYDALGRRATVTANGVTTHYVNEGPHVVAETDVAGNLQRRYEYGPGVDDILSMTVYSGGVTNTYRYVKDIQNTVWAIRDAAGAIVESYEYDAWGNLLAVRDGAGNPLTESAIGNRYLFQGREYSWTTGLYNFRARWYDPETGRWLCNDPIGISGGLNQYVFCGNNPIIYTDSFGLDANFTPFPDWVGYTLYKTNPGTKEQQDAWARRAGYTALAACSAPFVGAAAVRALPVVIAGGTATTTAGQNAVNRIATWQPMSWLDRMILWYPQSPPMRSTVGERLIPIAAKLNEMANRIGTRPPLSLWYQRLCEIFGELGRDGDSPSDCK